MWLLYLIFNLIGIYFIYKKSSFFYKKIDENNYYELFRFILSFVIIITLLWTYFIAKVLTNFNFHWFDIAIFLFSMWLVTGIFYFCLNQVITQYFQRLSSNLQIYKNIWYKMKSFGIFVFVFLTLFFWLFISWVTYINSIDEWFDIWKIFILNMIATCSIVGYLYSSLWIFKGWMSYKQARKDLYVNKVKWYFFTTLWVIFCFYYIHSFLSYWLVVFFHIEKYLNIISNNLMIITSLLSFWILFSWIFAWYLFHKVLSKQISKFLFLLSIVIIHIVVILFLSLFFGFVAN